MPTYELIYFQTEGRGEIIRYMFALTGVEYKDTRVSQEEWTELKPSIPYGQLPVLKVDGKILAGTGIIMRYLAEKYNLAGSNDFENAEIAGMCDLIDDFARKMIPFYLEKDETKKAALKKEFDDVHVPRYLGILESQITKNASDDGWCFGSKLTYADVSVYRIIDFLTFFNPNILDGRPVLQKLRASLEAVPNFAKWLKERPQAKKE